uniref:Uncharacterized protein n=1 Tax=Ixodes ricinus TaxID=34613 RepID=A0A6B0UWJ3_IXORI
MCSWCMDYCCSCCWQRMMSLYTAVHCSGRTPLPKTLQTNSRTVSFEASWMARMPQRNWCVGGSVSVTAVYSKYACFTRSVVINFRRSPNAGSSTSDCRPKSDNKLQSFSSVTAPLFIRIRASSNVMRPSLALSASFRFRKSLASDRFSWLTSM